MSSRILGDLAELTVGHVGPMASEYVDEGIPFLRSLNVRPFRIDLTGVKYISPEFHQQLGKSALKPGDVVVVRTGAPGTAAVVPEHLPVSNCSDVVIVRPGPELDARYLAYLINSVSRGYIDSRTVGAVQQHFNVGAAKGIPIPAGSVAQQRRIAEVLGALDDLIETNRVLISNLVRAARTAFAGFRPNEAASVRYADVANVSGGGTPSTKNPDYWGGSVHWATPTDMTALASPFLFDTSRRITEEGLAACASQLYEPGSILMTSRATIGVFAVAQVHTAVNQGFIVVGPRRAEDLSYLLLEMMSRVSDYVANANGTTFLEISRGKFKALTLDWPSDEDRVAFHERVGPVLNSAAVLESEVADLARTRDELLPLLMSGRIRVEDVEGIV